jgi:hypothetical protein
MAEKLPASFVFQSGIDERYVWKTLDISAESAKKNDNYDACYPPEEILKF